MDNWEWTRSVKIFIPLVNIYREIVTMEVALNPQADNMTRAGDIPSLHCQFPRSDTVGM